MGAAHHGPGVGSGRWIVRTDIRRARRITRGSRAYELLCNFRGATTPVRMVLALNRSRVVSFVVHRYCKLGLQSHLRCPDP